MPKRVEEPDFAWRTQSTQHGKSARRTNQGGPGAVSRLEATWHCTGENIGKTVHSKLYVSPHVICDLIPGGIFTSLFWYLNGLFNCTESKIVVTVFITLFYLLFLHSHCLVCTSSYTIISTIYQWPNSMSNVHSFYFFKKVKNKVAYSLPYLWFRLKIFRSLDCVIRYKVWFLADWSN